MPSRNDPCPCGSGRRYKHCHGAAASEPGVAALRIQGDAHVRNGHRERATEVWKQVLDIAADDAEALFHLGSLARLDGRHGEALGYLQRAREQAPGHPGVLVNLGLAFEANEDFVAAEECFRKARAAAPEAFEPLANLAQNLYQQRRFDEALGQFNILTERFDVRDAAILANRGVCAMHTGDYDLAADSYYAALRIDGSSPRLRCDLGFLELQRMRHAEAASFFESALAADPGNAAAASALLFARQSVFDWREFDARRAALLAQARTGASIAPWSFLALSDDPGAQRAVAESWTRAKTGPPAKLRSAPVPEREQATRLGFVSLGFGHHPVGRLAVELVERLARGGFEVILYSIAAARGDAIERRFIDAASRFHWARQWSADQLATRIRDDAIDVLFDLDGLTDRSLVDVFAQRPAPMQVNFLGYAGTIGTPVYDFIVTDRHCIPEDARRHYVERALYVDPCYLPSDSRRSADAAGMSRADYGLAEDGFVLCAFSASYKILPALFDAWMQVLARRPAAVLWLREVSEDAKSRLRSEAQARGVAADRLVFAPNDTLPRYLARFRLADLFVDTAPLGAHTTVNDALFAGLPVVTIDGESFGGRASASQVLAAGTPQLVARDIAGYRRVIDELIDDPRRLRQARAIVERIKQGAGGLFDGERYARRFADGVQRAWRSLQGSDR